MDTIRFIEETLDMKLLDCQKEMIRYIEKHPDCKVTIPRTRRLPNWYMAYCILKAIELEGKE